MKKFVWIMILGLVPFLMQANNTVPQETYEASGDQVKKTTYYADGTVKEIGYYTDKKLDGQWLRYDEKGDLQTVAFYKDGKKNGVWTFIKPNEILTVEYMNNKVVNTVAIR